MLCSSCIAIGYKSYDSLNNRSKWHNIILFIVCFILSIGFSLFCSDANLSKLYFGSIPSAFLICSIAGAISFISLFFIIREAAACRNRFLQYCGINSLLFLITHTTFKLTGIAWKIGKIIFGARGSGIVQNIQGIVCLLIILIFEIPILFLLKNTRLKALIDKK